MFVGFNDIATTHPHLVVEWADIEISPTEVTSNSEHKIRWQCAHGHIWRTSPRHRTKSKSKCPTCAGKIAVTGFSDLSSAYPTIAEEWDDEKDVEKVLPGSHYVAQWKCKDHGHVFACSVRKRTQRGYGCPFCAGRQVLTGFNDLATTHPHLLSEWDDDSDPTKISSGNGKSRQWRCENGHSWTASLNNRTRTNGTNCPRCSKNVSRAEQDIYEHIASIVPQGTEIKQSYRSLIKSELDIYLPEQEIAFEFNGLYWHSENAGKDKNYHYEKFTRCRDHGVQLIQVWEDDYNRNPELIKTMIAHKLGISVVEKVYARKTVFSQISSLEARSFLELNHLQGHHGTSSHYGLRTKGSEDIVAVMSSRYNKKDKSLEISRFATNVVIPGGFTKLLRGVVRQEQRPVEKVVSYSHNDHSWGQMYEHNGFTKVHDGSPGYFYVVNNRREHRLNYSPKRFRERDDLVFEEGKTERELAELNGLVRIWDAGSALWEKEIWNTSSS